MAIIRPVTQDGVSGLLIASLTIRVTQSNMAQVVTMTSARVAYSNIFDELWASLTISTFLHRPSTAIAVSSEYGSFWTVRMTEEHTLDATCNVDAELDRFTLSAFTNFKMIESKRSMLRDSRKGNTPSSAPV